CSPVDAATAETASRDCRVNCSRPDTACSQLQAAGETPSTSIVGRETLPIQPPSSTANGSLLCSSARLDSPLSAPQPTGQQQDRAEGIYSCPQIPLDPPSPPVPGPLSGIRAECRSKASLGGPEDGKNDESGRTEGEKASERLDSKLGIEKA
ncbi:hypothetical protein THAOC_19446, partial [Thalassiosira oceanica]